MGLVDKYYEAVTESENPSIHLTKMLAEMYGLEPSISFKRMFNSLLKLYGSRRVFSALVSVGTFYTNMESERALSRLQEKLKRKLVWSYEYELDKKATAKSSKLDGYIEERKQQLENKATELEFREFEVAEENDGKNSTDQRKEERVVLRTIRKDITGNPTEHPIEAE